MALRLDPVITAMYVVTLSAPAAAYASFRLVRMRQHDMHRVVQSVLLVMGWVALLSLELRIQFAGGAGVFIASAPPELLELTRALLRVHIVVAVATYGLWTWLAVTSWRRYELTLPGRFSRRHRQLGTAVFGGLCFTAASASGMFMLAFVL